MRGTQADWFLVSLRKLAASKRSGLQERSNNSHSLYDVSKLPLSSRREQDPVNYKALVSESQNFKACVPQAARMRAEMTTQNQEALRILVVDDDPIFRSLAVSRLVRLATEVVEAGDGGAAWSILARDTFQLALVDLEMPNLRGDELIRCIRGHPKTRHMPVIVVTSRNDAESVRSSLEAGATSFLTKPINWSMFTNHIDYLLRLNRVAESGHRAHEEAQQTIRCVTELAASLAAEMTRMTDRLEGCAKTAIESLNVSNQPARAMTALQSLIKETERGRHSVALAINAIEKAAGSDAHLSSSPPPPTMLKAS